MDGFSLDAFEIKNGGNVNANDRQMGGFTLEYESNDFIPVPNR